jgi:hypothetical protein
MIYTMLILSSILAKSQPYLLNNPQWIKYSVNIQTMDINQKSLLSLYEDTVVNNIVYRNLLFNNNIYQGAIREESGKIFYLPIGEVIEFVLYDFTVKIGETVVSNAKEGILSLSPTVNQIDTITIFNGEKRKRFYLDFGDIWIEGIGSIYGLLYPSYYSIPNYYVDYLVCFKQNDEIFFMNDSICLNNECCSFPLKSPNIKAEQEILLSPNPTTSLVHLSLNTKNCEELRIVDVLGNLLWHCPNFNDDDINIDLSSFPSGVYILVVKIPNQYIYFKIIKI